MNLCKDCALRLFNNNRHNISGTGNKYYGNLVVIPNVDYETYKNKDLDYSHQLEIIKDILNISSTGGLEQNLYFVPLIRCNENLGCKADDDIIKRCSKYLTEGIRIYNFRKILLCGSAAKYYLNIDSIEDNLNKVFLDTVNKRRYFVNYSPLVKYKDDKKFEQFKYYLNKYHYSVTNRMYDYDMVRLL